MNVRSEDLGGMVGVNPYHHPVSKAERLKVMRWGRGANPLSINTWGDIYEYIGITYLF